MWRARFHSLKTEIPAWEEALKTIPNDYLEWLAERMETTDPKIPDFSLVFRPLMETKPEDVRAVILGQDPYPGEGLACGRAFATSNNKCPMSLRNLLKELKSNTQTDLNDWVRQGVLLINVSPTLGGMSDWIFFTSSILIWLAQTHKDVVFIFMGAFTKPIAAHIENASPGKVILVPHPAARGGQFQQAQLLKKIQDAGLKINW